MNTEREIREIKRRNAKVEADKAWETSFTRRALITALTYLVIVIFFIFADVQRPWANAVVPALAFLLSTMTLPLVKRLWLRYR